MSDDKSKRGKPDRIRVSGTEKYEVDYVAKKTGASKSAVKAAAKSVGPMRKDVEAKLTGKSGAKGAGKKK